MATFPKQRRFPRFTVEGVQGTMALSTEVEIVNLSLGGMAIRAHRRLNIGAECKLRLDVGERQLTVDGVVVWSALTGISQEGDDTVTHYSAGVKFRDFLSERLEDLISFIDRHKVAEEHRLSGIRFQIKAPGKAVLDGVASYNVKLISLGGMLIETDRTFGIDQIYPMEIQPPEQPPIEFVGRVASVLDSEKGPGRHEIGIEFGKMSDDSRRRLTAFIATVSGD